MIHGAIHIHSSYSYDGKLSLLELKKLFLKNGIQFACMTEHTDFIDPVKANEFMRECEILSDNNFVFIPGFEVPYKKAHILMIGATRFVSNFADAETLYEWSKVSRMVFLAHPHRNDFEVDDEVKKVISGIEIWNSQYDGKRVPRTRAVSLLHDLRIENQKLFASAGLDFHRESHIGGPAISIDGELNKETILSKIGRGEFFIEGNNLSIDSKGDLNFLQKNIFYGFVSAFSIFFILTGKKVNSVLKKIGIGIPKVLSERIRRGV